MRCSRRDAAAAACADGRAEERAKSWSEWQQRSSWPRWVTVESESLSTLPALHWLSQLWWWVEWNAGLPPAWLLTEVTLGVTEALCQGRRAAEVAPQCVYFWREMQTWHGQGALALDYALRAVATCTTARFLSCS